MAWFRGCTSAEHLAILTSWGEFHYLLPGHMPSRSRGKYFAPEEYALHERLLGVITQWPPTESHACGANASSTTVTGPAARFRTASHVRCLTARTATKIRSEATTDCNTSSILVRGFRSTRSDQIRGRQGWRTDNRTNLLVWRSSDSSSRTLSENRGPLRAPAACRLSPITRRTSPRSRTTTCGTRSRIS